MTDLTKDQVDAMLDDDQTDWSMRQYGEPPRKVPPTARAMLRSYALAILQLRQARMDYIEAHFGEWPLAETGRS